MKFLNKFIAAGLIALPLLFAGCASNEKTSSPEDAKFEKELKNIVIEDSLADDIKVTLLRRWETEHGLINILIRARYRDAGVLEWVFCSYSSITIAYRFAWYDDNGVESESSSAASWSVLEVQSGEELGFNDIAPDKKMKNFKLFIKRVTKENADQFKRKQPASPKPEQKTDGNKTDKSEKKGTLSKDVKVPPSTPTQVNPEPKTADSKEVKPAKKGTVSEDVKVPPTTPTQAKPEPKNEEAEADAASIRQAKSVENTKK